QSILDPSGRRRGEPLRLVPHSGLQFLTYAFDLEKAGRFSRSFIEHRAPSAAPDGTVPVELRPAWNDQDAEAPPHFEARDRDVTYDINKQKAIEPFLNQWTPVPLLVMNRDDQGREQLGPTNWCRVRVAQDKSDQSGAMHYVVFAIDTEIVKRQPQRPY